ncbi:DUF3862 domain-containing protein [Companilactobacillus hulinensis]|uniref:DUF3862 domain-containing protein n=1 Tax=Companilactobacillus hulinensis TaxID=2486007 RepID=UPI000F791909|nr:DUF3862 domain-containing protein [Companilactobacillus hulinensis]
MKRSEFRHRNNRRNKLITKWWFWLIIVLVLGTAIFIGYKFTAQPQYIQDRIVIPTRKHTKVSKPSKNDNTVTLKKYNSIYLDLKNGISSDSAQKIFGKFTSRKTSTIGDIETTRYVWKNQSNRMTLSIGFTNNHAISKSISGLKIDRQQEINNILYGQIKNGLSVEAVTALLGKPNGYSENVLESNHSNVFSYTNDSLGKMDKNLVITFTDGKVSGKNWLSLQ